MNTANLQMEGTLLALAALCEALKQKGVLTGEEIAGALACAEAGISSRAPGMSEANREAIRFPIRFLRRAMERDGSALDYAAIAAGVGRTRDGARALPTE
ncbi:hypothetical protein [Ancylobacter oerskovii]|uniref:Uncharacterized protein n=1 Tax=Ancylobacter oerskovii TaxID=459519 RepID=A0ABW4YZ18_9HYPH|nr:hypothetical protein [Ancylobacter oerskovii]MBS7543925.1 hypothetical protein [Ancylobacter oerskovii]